jgi:hypothetical protein
MVHPGRSCAAFFLAWCESDERQRVRYVRTGIPAGSPDDPDYAPEPDPDPDPHGGRPADRVHAPGP